MTSVRLGYPDDILNKPGGLTDQERTMMESHVDRVVSILG
jgi:HD-GYP domain-containing protein (c-di-GMP phosphodiesterase class II)